MRNKKAHTKSAQRLYNTKKKQHSQTKSFLFPFRAWTSDEATHFSKLVARTIKNGGFVSPPFFYILQFLQIFFAKKFDSPYLGGGSFLKFTFSTVAPHLRNLWSFEWLWMSSSVFRLCASNSVLFSFFFSSAYSLIIFQRYFIFSEYRKRVGDRCVVF